MSQIDPSDIVLVDANVLIAICSKENATYQQAEAAFRTHAESGRNFFAPNVVVAEVLYVLCRKHADGLLNESEHGLAIEGFKELMEAVTTPEAGDSQLISRAEVIRGSYGCSRMSDSLYLAYADELAKTQKVELLTFDEGLINHAAKAELGITINILKT